MSTVRVVSLFSGIGASDMGMYAAAASLGIEVEVRSMLVAIGAASDNALSA